MDTLPQHGRINCTKCFDGKAVEFDVTKTGTPEWRITANPLAWGNPKCEIVVLGFSKGPTQAGALAKSAHDEIAYKGSRANVGKILFHIGLLPGAAQQDLGNAVSRLIADRSGKFHFGSLVRCTVERFEQKTSSWKGSGGGMLDKFVGTNFGKKVTGNCTEKFLCHLPASARLIVMFGLGSKLNYVSESFELYRKTRGGNWTWINDVSYTDGKIVVVHVEHFASQGALIPQWLGNKDHARSKYGEMARTAVEAAKVSAVRH